MLRLAVLAVVVIVVTAAPEGRQRNKDRIILKASSKVLQTDVDTVAANNPNTCDPVEYAYVNKNHELWLKENGKDEAYAAAYDVKAAGAGYDDSRWYITSDGKVFHRRFGNQFEEVEVPEGVQFINLAVKTFSDAYALADNGDLYNYAATKWYKIESAKNGPKTNINIGALGFMLGTDRPGKKIFLYDNGKRTWGPFEKQGVTADMADMDHIVVVTGNDNSVEKKVNGKWSKVSQKCLHVSAAQPEIFYCVTPQGELKTLPF